MNLKQTIFVAIMGAGLALCGAADASAGTPAGMGQNHHPRRVEVNHRLAKQNIRVDRDLREGKITRRQAAALHGEDRAVRMHERRDALLHGGHLTRHEQARLNHRENRTSGRIYRAAH
jgi:hypothetical protein